MMDGAFRPPQLPASSGFNTWLWWARIVDASIDGTGKWQIMPCLMLILVPRRRHAKTQGGGPERSAPQHL